MANRPPHDDFGEKIGGAKKDLWSGRGLYSDDLAGMNEREADKFVKKDNVWKKPDYGAMIDGGVPVDVAYFIKKVRDSVNVAPQYTRTDDTPEKRLDRQKEYVDTVREVQGAIEGVRTREDAKAAFEKLFVAGGYIQDKSGYIGGGHHYEATEKGRNNPVITNKLINMVHIRSDRMFEYDFTRKAEREQFGVPKEDKVPKGYEIRHNDGKNTWSKDDDWKSDTWYVAKGHRIIKTNLATKADALKWAQDFAKGKAADGKTRFVPPQLEHIRREGPDYRQGRNVGGQDYIDAFGFRGGEFGNWMSQADRQASLNMGFDALKDLAAALKISDRDISYGGALSIAFGARGSGNAVAHYEPLRQVINLTKMRGAGSLAHEWWHGLDDFLGKQAGLNGLLSEKPHKHPLMEKLVDTIKYKAGTPEQAAQQAEAQDSRTRRNAEGWLKSIVFTAVSKDEGAAAKYEQLKEDFLSGKPGTVDALNELRKSVTGRVIPKKDRETLATFEHIMKGMAEQTGAPASIKVPTDYFRNSKEMGQLYEKDGGYWDSNVELTARAFATYIMDSLPGRSDYLNGHAECAVNFSTDENGELTILKAYPEGAERAAINAVFDEIVAELKRDNILTHEEKTAPEPRAPIASPARRDTPVLQNDTGEQLTFAGMERPSVMDKLAAAKEAAAKGAAEKSANPKKSHDKEL